jgi:hypothetical protein
MGARQKDWARRSRASLMDKHGNKCAHCGDDQNLEFDCIFPMGDDRHRMDASHRQSFYNQQERNGNLQLLCKRCNAIKGNSIPECVSSESPETNNPF